MKQLNSQNNAIIATAGSGKTEEIVNRALAIPSEERVLMTTYTENSTNEIKARIISKAGYIPENIHVMPWFTFLIKHGIKPYQNPLVGINKVSGLYFDRRPGYPRKSDPRSYYFSKDGKVYRDFASEAVIYINELHDGAVIGRINSIYKHIFYDEVQDVSARDFELFELLMGSPSSVTVVGDPRQGTFKTTQSKTNQRYTGSGVVDWLEGLESQDVLKIEYQTQSVRCNQPICDVADGLYSQLSPTKSHNDEITGHDGVFLIKEDDVDAYCRQFETKPQVLTWDKNGKDFGMGSRNMGDVKGLTFDRVIISTTNPMKNYFSKGEALTATTKAKLYVAITRARYSVAIVVTEQGDSDIPLWPIPTELE